MKDGMRKELHGCKRSKIFCDLFMLRPFQMPIKLILKLFFPIKVSLDRITLTSRRVVDQPNTAFFRPLQFCCSHMHYIQVVYTYPSCRTQQGFLQVKEDWVWMDCIAWEQYHASFSSLMAAHIQTAFLFHSLFVVVLLCLSTPMIS